MTVVEVDGPRRIIRSTRNGVWFYVSHCTDCGRVKSHGHRLDAQDWIDAHHCGERS